MNEQRYNKRLIGAGIVLGMGLGGFLDGILLHMIFQWHNMLSSVIPPITMHAMRVNMLWDGIFHAFTWAMTVIGLFLLWGAVQHPSVLPSTLSFVGLLVIGFGLFNLIEGIINHLLLAIHHVKEVPDPLMWDIAFLLFGGVLLIAVGWMICKWGARRTA